MRLVDMLYYRFLSHFSYDPNAGYCIYLSLVYVSRSNSLHISAFPHCWPLSEPLFSVSFLESSPTSASGEPFLKRYIYLLCLYTLIYKYVHWAKKNKSLVSRAPPHCIFICSICHFIQ